MRSELSHCLCCLDQMNRRKSTGDAGANKRAGVGDAAAVDPVAVVAGPAEAGKAVGDAWLPELLSLSNESTRRTRPTPVKKAPMAARSRPLRERRGPSPSGSPPTGTGYQCQSSSLESRRPMTKSGKSEALRFGRGAVRPGGAGDYCPQAAPST